jgi:hypothetical protein
MFSKSIPQIRGKVIDANQKSKLRINRFLTTVGILLRKEPRLLFIFFEFGTKIIKKTLQNVFSDTI